MLEDYNQKTATLFHCFGQVARDSHFFVKFKIETRA